MKNKKIITTITTIMLILTTVVIAQDEHPPITYEVDWWFDSEYTYNPNTGQYENPPPGELGRRSALYLDDQGNLKYVWLDTDTGLRSGRSQAEITEELNNLQKARSFTTDYARLQGRQTTTPPTPPAAPPAPTTTPPQPPAPTTPPTTQTPEQLRQRATALETQASQIAQTDPTHATSLRLQATALRQLATQQETPATTPPITPTPPATTPTVPPTQPTQTPEQLRQRATALETQASQIAQTDPALAQALNAQARALKDAAEQQSQELTIKLEQEALARLTERGITPAAGETAQAAEIRIAEERIAEQQQREKFATATGQRVSRIIGGDLYYRIVLNSQTYTQTERNGQIVFETNPAPDGSYNVLIIHPTGQNQIVEFQMDILGNPTGMWIHKNGARQQQTIPIGEMIIKYGDLLTAIGRTPTPVSQPLPKTQGQIAAEKFAQANEELKQQREDLDDQITALKESQQALTDFKTKNKIENPEEYFKQEKEPTTADDKPKWNLLKNEYKTLSDEAKAQLDFTSSQLADIENQMQKTQTAFKSLPKDRQEAKQEQFQNDLKLLAQTMLDTAKEAYNNAALLNDEKQKEKFEEQIDKAQEALAEANAELRRIQFWKDDGVIPGIVQAIKIAQSLIKSYEMFSGIARLGTMFLTGDDWQKYRNEVSQTMCDTIILGGKQCWTSKICDTYIETKPEGNSVIARTPDGQPTSAIHLEASKSLPMQTDNQTEYIYKIEYTLTNPTNKQMQYNIQLTTNTGETIKAYKEDKQLQASATNSKIGSTAIYQQSSKNYTSICLTFNPAITTFTGKTTKQFCNKIPQYEGQATMPYTNTTIEDNQTTGTQPGTTTTTKPAEFNDF